MPSSPLARSDPVGIKLSHLTVIEQEGDPGKGQPDFEARSNWLESVFTDIGDNAHRGIEAQEQAVGLVGVGLSHSSSVQSNAKDA